MVHHRVQLTAYLEIQLGDMVVDQRFVELFHPLTGLTDAIHKHLHRRGETPAAGASGERGIVQKVVDISEVRRRGEINFFQTARRKRPRPPCFPAAWFAPEQGRFLW